jgi:hypothetical protein
VTTSKDLAAVCTKHQRCRLGRYVFRVSRQKAEDDIRIQPQPLHSAFLFLGCPSDRPTTSRTSSLLEKGLVAGKAP